MKNVNLKSKRKKTNFLIKICISVVLVLLLVIVIRINVQINDAKVELLKMQEEYTRRLLSIEQIKADIAKLPDNIEDLDEETLKKIASDELNLRDSDIIIFSNSQPN